MAVAAQAPTRGVSDGPQAVCAWCGGPATEIGFRLAQCASCGTATTYPPPDEDELAAAYGGWYRPAEGRFGAVGDDLLRWSRGTLARRLDRRAPRGPVLDVGSGDGALLDALGARGREATGLERASRRADVRATEIVDFRQDAGEWAAVVFWHSLEHLRQPAAALDRATELLAPGGLLVVAMPNWGSWQARSLKQRWLALDIPRHLVHVPAETLLRSLRDRGYAIERVSHWRGGQVVFGWLHGLVAALPGGLDLYDALRQTGARRERMSPARRAAAIAAGAALAPLAVALSIAEVARQAGGTVYVEARRR